MSEVKHRTSGARRMVAAIAGALPLAVVAVSWILWQEKLPTELASHWSGTGEPDGFMSTSAALAVGLALTGIPAVVGLIAASMPTLRPALLRGILGFAGMASGMGAATWLISAGLTLHAGNAGEAVLGWWLAALMASFLYGAVPYFIAPKPDPMRVFSVKAYDGHVPLGAQETGAWSRAITSKLLMLMALVLLAVAAVIYLPSIIAGDGVGSWLGFGAMLASVVVVALIAHLQVTVDWRGLRIVSTVGHIPLKRIPLEDIADLDARELRPSEWGGWGYRVMPGRSAVIMRAGPGLVISTVQGKVFAVTVPDPEAAAGLLIALRDRKHDGGARPSATAQTS